MNNDQLVYLKPNVVIEPLIDQWYAWPHLISPATAAMNFIERHIKIMDSYIQAPHIHAAAVKNPKMKGGPFMDLGGKRVEDIKALKENTLSTQAKILEFARALKEMDKMLKTEAHGFSLEPLYQKIPPILKGYVELFYDLNNHPSYRLFEPLLYHSEFYRRASQSLALWMTNNDERPFVLSTPRIAMEGVLNVPIAFDNPVIDQLSAMKRKPAPLEDIRLQLGLATQDLPLFNSFFTTEEPTPYRKYEGDKIRMRYFGHACILVETREISILLDPLISYYGYQTEVNRFSDIDLPDQIDFVLITHNHQDHILFETLLPLRHKIKNIIVPKTYGGTLQDPNLKLMFQQIGFSNVFELGEMESIRIGECEITGLPFLGEHCDIDIRSKICHHVKIGDFKMLFAADSCNIQTEVYRNVQALMGVINILFLGMECDGAPLTWLYGPLLTEPISREKDNSRRLAGSNFERGMELVNVFQPNEIYVYAMGQEPWLEFISSIKYTPESNPIIQSNKLIAACRDRGLTAERLFGEKELLFEKHQVAM